MNHLNWCFMDETRHYDLPIGFVDCGHPHGLSTRASTSRGRQKEKETPRFLEISVSTLVHVAIHLNCMDGRFEWNWPGRSCLACGGREEYRGCLRFEQMELKLKITKLIFIDLQYEYSYCVSVNFLPVEDRKWI